MNEDFWHLLKQQSMLHQAAANHKAFRARSKAIWNNPYVKPAPREAIRMGSVWFTWYPGAAICAPGSLPLETLADKDLLRTLAEIGIRGIHTGPMTNAGVVKIGPGGVEQVVRTTDGWYDPISYALDPAIGTTPQLQLLVDHARERGLIVNNDNIPGHTGKGIDWCLAEAGFEDYPGLYVMVEIDPADYDLLPDLQPESQESAPLNAKQVQQLAHKGYLPGALQRSMADPKATSYSATAPFTGCDGISRRWVYLHYFKETQPTLNWMDPGAVAFRMISGQILHMLHTIGARGLRLDAVPFLGIERLPNTDPICAWSEGHPLAVHVTNMLAWLIRQSGGFSFQELNLDLEQIAMFGRQGPDLSYDFITRPAVEHSLLTGDAGLLRLSYELMIQHAIDPGTLVHALQNHDELTYELVHFATHPDDTFRVNGQDVTGRELRDRIRGEMEERAAGKDAPYNALSGNGLCTTFASYVKAALGKNGGDVKKIKQGHLLLAAFNLFQPGVFALSGWDVTGAYPLDPASIPPDLLGEGPSPDNRWLNRGAYDLMDVNPSATHSPFGIPKAECLYGSLPAQMQDPASFARLLQSMLTLRREMGVAEGSFCGIPETSDPAAFALAFTIPDGRLFVNVMNFHQSREIDVTIDLNRWSSLWPSRLPALSSQPQSLILEPWTHKLLEFA